ncbi:MAG: outer membrane usher protein [Enterobacterales bacterium]|uniref:outer membrane usher protein n=1 Tax=Serratia sp. (in: enterobacteria) TaxID=616 RepID=UPI003F3E450D
MKLSPVGKLARLQVLGLCISWALLTSPKASFSAQVIEFNTDVLDVNDKQNFDLSQFSRGTYIMPGTYGMLIRINKHELPEQQVQFLASENDPSISKACINSALVAQLGLKPGLVDDLTWWHQGECLDEGSLAGMEVRGELSTSSLYVSIPQAYLEHTSEDWDPPSRWDEGIPGILLDYSVNAQSQQQLQQKARSQNLSGNGVVGTNLSSWRLRADWQGNFNTQSGAGGSTQRQFDWSRFYAFRAIAPWRSKLTLGENSLGSGMFDSFSFTGASLVSDDSMLPPNLRGYAPEVVGVAKTNARVTVSQQGRVLYETQVASGPFRIQDIHDAVTGELNVRVEEQDGSVQAFNLNTATIPYLTRPGLVRFRFATGKPSGLQHRIRGPLFGTGEFSWGVSNGWSLYGGALIAGEYNAASLGIGRDLMIFGALSVDATQSRASLPFQQGTLSGGSYRLSYSKSFEEYDSQVAFAGYRFSEQNFMNMGEFLEARETGNRSGGGKEMYTISLNKHFRDWGLSSNLNYSHETYWNRPANDRYTLTLSRNFDFGRWRNVNLSLSAYRNNYNQSSDNGGYISLSMPWGERSYVSYSGSVADSDTTHRVGYSTRLDERSNYQLSAGSARSGVNLSGNYSREGDFARISANASYQESRYSALGFSAQGGMTLTKQGGALHRAGVPGGTRMLIDTAGVAGIPVRGYGSNTQTNRWGKAVIGDMNSYYRSQASIDLNKIGDNAEALNSVVQLTLTEGAIGYRQFEVVAGGKAMAVIKLADGSEPPFGASVMNARQQETGIVNEGGSVYLSGIKAGDVMTVHWNGGAQCAVTMPESLPENMMIDSLLLPCQRVDAQPVS